MMKSQIHKYFTFLGIGLVAKTDSQAFLTRYLKVQKMTWTYFLYNRCLLFIVEGLFSFSINKSKYIDIILFVNLIVKCTM